MSEGKTRLWRLLALLLTAAMLFAACGDDDDDDGATATTAADGGGEKKEVALAFVGPLTGPNANLGINIRNGMKVAIAEANEESEDYEYSMKEFDTQGDPAQAPGQKDKYIPDDEIIGVVGPTFSGETKAVLPDLEQAKLVMVSASATNVDLPTVVPNNTVFHRIIPDDGVQAEGVASYVQTTLKAKKVALIHDNSDYGKGLFEGVLALLTKAGIPTAVTDAIDPKSQDYSAAVNKVKAAGNIDVLFYGGYYAEAGRFKKQLTDGGVRSVFLSGDGALDPGFIEASGAAGGEGAQITCPCRLATAADDQAAKDFVKKYKEQNNNAEPGTYSSEGYDAATILINGIEEGNDTREELLEYVEDFDSLDGISKKIEFEENGNVKTGDIYVYEVRAGKLVELGTAEELAGGGSSSGTTTTARAGATTTTTR